MGGHGPVQPVGDAGSKVQYWMVVVVVDVVVVTVVVVDVDGPMMTSFCTGAQSSRGTPTGMLGSRPN